MTVDTKRYMGRWPMKTVKKKAIINYKPFAFMKNLLAQTVSIAYSMDYLRMSGWD